MKDKVRKYKRIEDVNITKLIRLIEDGSIKPYTSALMRALGFSWMTTKRLVMKHPEVEATMLLRREEIVEIAEEQLPELLYGASDKVKADLVKWVLKTRDERYKEKKEEVAPSVNITIEGYDTIKTDN